MKPPVDEARYPLARLVFDAAFLLFIAALVAMSVLFAGCAGAKVLPARNEVTAHQTSSGPTERITLTIGGTPAKEGQ